MKAVVPKQLRSAAGGQSGPTGQSTREARRENDCCAVFVGLRADCQEALSHLTGKLSSSFAFGLLVAESCSNQNQSRGVLSRFHVATACMPRRAAPNFSWQTLC